MRVIRHTGTARPQHSRIYKSCTRAQSGRIYYARIVMCARCAMMLRDVWCGVRDASRFEFDGRAYTRGVRECAYNISINYMLRLISRARASVVCVCATRYTRHIRAQRSLSLSVCVRLLACAVRTCARLES